VLARLVAQVVLAGAAVALIHGVSPVWQAALLVIVTAWAVNAYNFMDGSDGMAGGMAVIGFGSYAVDAALMGHTQLATAAAGVAGASAGFLVFNFAPARVFMGDAGSAPLGFLAAALGLLGWEAEVWSAWFPVIVFSPFLTDATLTLFRRLARGERIWLAHKEHLYQRMVAGGLGHTRTALVAYGVMALSAGLALAVEQAPRGTAGSLALAWLVGCVLLHFFWVRRFSPT
jgi:UDP-N-acetylmuramyl pentapeptide phosphotransferase/UDP-N-acetylglucosamine-1-phosphate transferase